MCRENNDPIRINYYKKVKFLGLTIYNYLSWNFHIEETIPKLNEACFVIITVRSYLSYEIVRKIYFSHFHSIMSYGIIFWGSSSENNSVFKTQTRTIRVIVNSSSGTFSNELFKELQILILHCQCIYSLTMFVTNNRQLFKSNSDDHNLSTRYNCDLHLPTANLTIFFYLGIIMYNHLPQSLKELSHSVRWFRLTMNRIFFKKSLLFIGGISSL